MKGQISFVEFMASMLIFIAFVSYFSIQILTFVPLYINEITAERLRSEAFQVSELLINDPGEPLNWNSGNVKRIGLSDDKQNKTNLLSTTKISTLNSMCKSDYNLVKEKIGLDHDFSLFLIDGKTNQIKIDCHPPVAEFRQVNITIRRIVAYEDGNSYAEMILQVW
jgi:hypothetical protein